MQAHLALVEIQNDDNKTPIAVSFPDYRERSEKSAAFIGKRMRLLAVDHDDLKNLAIGKWLARLDDYVHIKAIKNVPADIKSYESFSRVSKAGSPDKHIRRRMKRHDESLEQASEHFTDYKMDEEIKALPFVKMKSLGSDNEFNMSIRKKVVELTTETFCFNTYGFNRCAALPKF